jgi:hypothetical protein
MDGKQTGNTMKKVYETLDGPMTERDIRNAVCDGFGVYDEFTRQDVVAALGESKGVDNALTMMLQKGILGSIGIGAYEWRI